MSTIEPGDKFRSLDKRDVETRIVEVVSVMNRENAGGGAYVKTVQHWDESRIGRHHWVAARTLGNRKLWQRISH